MWIFIAGCIFGFIAALFIMQRVIRTLAEEVKQEAAAEQKLVVEALEAVADELRKLRELTGVSESIIEKVSMNEQVIAVIDGPNGRKVIQ